MCVDVFRCLLVIGVKTRSRFEKIVDLNVFFSNNRQHRCSHHQHIAAKQLKSKQSKQSISHAHKVKQRIHHAVRAAVAHALLEAHHNVLVLVHWRAEVDLQALAVENGIGLRVSLARGLELAQPEHAGSRRLDPGARLWVERLSWSLAGRLAEGRQIGRNARVHDCDGARAAHQQLVLGGDRDVVVIGLLVALAHVVVARSLDILAARLLASHNNGSLTAVIVAELRVRRLGRVASSSGHRKRAGSLELAAVEIVRMLRAVVIGARLAGVRNDWQRAASSCARNSAATNLLGMSRAQGQRLIRGRYFC